ncbi:DUF294 nucleotidyltransferase-like domain-containing protein [Fundidesulfovibrio soli]|uniref:DUF294 nucleotidyltransferase-like domain-containing protein n=1 Tax=Fundidesulfovibrio soli TaxID=2922716 RepID=UPI001FAEBB30|nr:DUF294 nucleotidyltransferase-like domain-containing protein [Fundidesulfovibrio soli]
MIIEDVVNFLRECPPLSFLEPARVVELARVAAVDFYPAGTLILGPGGAGAGHMLAVKKGVVLCEGHQLGEGELFGPDGRAEASEDCVCCLLPPEAVRLAVQGRPELEDFLAGRLSEAVLELGMAGMVRGIPAWVEGRPLASVHVAEVVRRCEGVPGYLPIEAVAKAMGHQGSDAAVVLDESGIPCGVVTDRDFRSKAVAKGLGPHTPVREVMTSPVVSLDGEATCFEALMAMTRHHIRHVVVMEGRLALGVLSAQELMLRRVGSPPALASLAAGASDLDDLARAASGLDRLALTLLREGAGAASLGRMVGGVREALVSRACQLGEDFLGPPPGGYCLMVFGRAARREGPALCPMWHALIHEEGPEMARWAAQLGQWLGQALESAQMAGGPRTPGASNEAWRGSLKAWRERMTTWMRHGPASKDWLDFRPVYGQAWMAEALRAQMLSLAAGSHSPVPGPSYEGAPLVERLVELTRGLSLRANVSRISSVERAQALEALGWARPGLAQALEYLTAWQWVGEPVRRSPLDRALERMCRTAAGG